MNDFHNWVIVVENKACFRGFKNACILYIILSAQVAPVLFNKEG